jgi:hypothetical protein
VTPDAKKAMYENSLLLAGTQVMVGPFDDDLTHDAIHDIIFKRTDWDKLPKIIQDNAFQHRMIHQTRLQAKMAQMQQEAAAGAGGGEESGGGPGGGGAPPAEASSGPPS